LINWLCVVLSGVCVSHGINDQREIGAMELLLPAA